MLSKIEIAERLRRAATVMRVGRQDPHRARAYETAAQALLETEADLSTLVAAGTLTTIHGVGSSLAAVIGDLVLTGRSEKLEGIDAAHPPGLAEMGDIPGLTLKRVRLLHELLGVSNLVDLRGALDSGAALTVPGFGPKTVATLREGLSRREERTSSGSSVAPSGGGGDGTQASTPSATASATAVTSPPRILLVDALDWGERLIAYLGAAAGAAVERADLVGSVRRRCETARDINLLCASLRPGAATSALLGHPAVGSVVRQSEGGGAGGQDAFCVVRLAHGPTVTLQTVRDDHYGAALVEATGSSAHVNALVDRAAARGVSMTDGFTASFPGLPEAGIYAALGLPFIPPELRDDAGAGPEATDVLGLAAAGDDFDDLVSEGDVRGFCHCHTVHSDGRHTVEEMARAADALGAEYMTITDHSPAAHYAGGVSVDQLRRQWDDIARVQEQVKVKLLRGTESDILADGSLDYPDAILESLDVVIASVHVRHKMDGAAMTERLVRAMRQPVFKIWGHALGRLLLRRDAIDCDVEKVLDAIAESRAAIEVNGDPHRLDLEPRWIRAARVRGIKFVISTDAHGTRDLGNVRFGVAMARRGGLRRHEVLNTLDATGFAAAVRPVARGAA